MSQFEAFEQGIEVNGQTMLSIVDGMGAFTGLAGRYFQNVGLPKPNEIVPTEFYSQQRWLDAFAMISMKIGSNTLLQIGKSIPENAIFPPQIQTLEDALASIHVAHHMNHRNRLGQVLFDPTRNQILEGIGHYGYRKVPGKNLAILTCKNPYPCDFDLGIITAMARRFESTANVKHDDSQPCRKHGAESCTYSVTWDN